MQEDCQELNVTLDYIVNSRSARDTQTTQREEKKHEWTADVMVCKEGFFVNMVACLFFLYLGKMVERFRAWNLELDLLRIYPQHYPCKY